MIFQDRADAGRHLAQKLTQFHRKPKTLILALPRGGVPVAFEVSQRLDIPMDICLVRKLGLPLYEELAMGAITENSVYLHDAVIHSLSIPKETIDAVIHKEKLELQRRKVRYRGHKPPVEVEGHRVILVDDGLATGSTMLAAVKALRALKPVQIVVAVPVSPPDTLERLKTLADDVVCLHSPDNFQAVGGYYADFSQTTDEEVIELLTLANQIHPAMLHDTGARAKQDFESDSLIRQRKKMSSLIDSVTELQGKISDYNDLMKMASHVDCVLLGEATHGTHEFYKMRAEITQRLVDELDFCAVAVEADWPDAYRTHLYVNGLSDDTSASQALSDFERFPTWMWRNEDVRDLVEWMKDFNDHRAKNQKSAVGFYGIDLYSLYRSIDEVLSFLEKNDPDAARRARARYACFDHFDRNSQTYGYASSGGFFESCEDAVLEQLLDLKKNEEAYRNKAFVRHEPDAYFSALQNARLVANAENYYRSMFRGRVSSWNLRDRHMVETIEALSVDLKSRGKSGKIIVWAHNSHLGDARATEMGAAGEWNVGQLVRERLGQRSLLVGFTTHTGTVTAASDWGARPERKQVRPALDNSFEKLFHEVGLDSFYLPIKGPRTLPKTLDKVRLERAIGVIYSPETERVSHYFDAHLTRQFDVVFHVDETRAVIPLEQNAEWLGDEPPETFPFAV